MTGGTVVVLGETGRNFAAGMSRRRRLRVRPGRRVRVALQHCDGRAGAAAVRRRAGRRKTDPATWHKGEADEIILKG
jgi:hypothetical protein